MNETRNVAIYLAIKLRRDTFREIEKQFGIDDDSEVRRVMARMKTRLAKDRFFAGRVESNLAK